MKTTKNDVKQELEKNCIAYEDVVWNGDALIIDNANENDIRKLEIYKNGEIYLQSLSSVLCKQYNKERKKVVDYIFENDRPIYLQLVEKLRIEIVSGKLKQGERLPSVRELALIAKVNPNTMQKALAELENEGLVYTERTNGKFVTQNQALIETIKKELAQEKVSNYLEGMKNIGITYEEAMQYLQELGKNGTGKSALIKIINELLIPTSGEVLIYGEKPGVKSKKIDKGKIFLTSPANELRNIAMMINILINNLMRVWVTFIRNIYKFAGYIGIILAHKSNSMFFILLFTILLEEDKLKKVLM